MFKCAQKKAKQLRDIERTQQIQAASHKRTFYDILPDEVEGFDAVVQDARKKLENQWNQQCHALHEYASTAKTPTQKVAVSKVGQVRPPSIEGRATLSVIKRKANRSVLNSKGVFFTKTEVVRMKITLQVEGFIHGIITIWSTHTCADK